MQINVNGRSHEVDVEPDMPLLWVLRDVLGLTGTKYGCGIAQCGACTVHLDGEPVRSCSLPGIGGGRQARRHDRGPVARQLAPGAEGLGRRSTCPSAAIASRARSWPPRRCSRRTRSRPTRTSTTAMTNICRCGTYQRIRAAIHMAAGTGKGGGSIIHMGAATDAAAADALSRRSHNLTQAEGDAMKKTQSGSARIAHESRAPQVHRRLGAAASGGLALGFQPPVRHESGRRPGARRRRRQRDQRVGRRQARRHLRHPHRARGDGAGHAHRPRAARRRGAGVRLEQDRHRADHRRAEPGAQARLARHVDRRQPRHPRLAGLRPPGRRRGAHDAAAGGGERVERAGRAS